ncbi:MAG: phage holin family protein [Planctomycetaceae bacterium]|nr:phage holin family protein [Planctomycetaceae bacterium]
MNGKETNKDPATQRESLTELLERLAKNSAAVVQDEIELAIQGVREKVRGVRNGALTVAIGTLISFAAFMSFCAALIIGLTSYMAPVFAAIVTGAALALIGVAIAFIGCRRLKKSVYKKIENNANAERITKNG